MERLLQKIRELESEAKILIDKESTEGSDSIPSSLHQQQPPPPPPPLQASRPSPGHSSGKAQACTNEHRQHRQQQQRFSPRLSTAARIAGPPRIKPNGAHHQVLAEDRHGNTHTPPPKKGPPPPPPPPPTNGENNSTSSREVRPARTGEIAADDGDWVREMRNAAGRWTGKRLVVLSLFDGIGGVWAALTRLGIPFHGFSSEVSAPAVEVVKARFPQVQHLGDVRKLGRSDIGEEVDLLVGGFPCQDLSCMGKREGLHGPRSRLFFDLLEALKIFQPKWFLVENVASMTWIDRVEISKYTGVRPLELDSIELAPTRRRRLYWTNIPHPPRMPRVRDHPSTLVQSCLQNAVALEEKTGVIIATTSESSSSYNLEKAFVERLGGLRKLAQPEVDRLLGFMANHTDVILSTNHTENNSCPLELVMENGSNRLRYISHHELELLMGYPAHHTAVPVHEAANSLTSLISLTDDKNTKAAMKGRPRKGGDAEKNISRKEPLRASVRWLLLGNTFSVQVIAYLLSPLLKRSVRELSRPVHISGPTVEKDCSVMEVGDVWALYNEQERPNWYALIVRRTGDRFSSSKTAPSAKITKKLPLHVELRYLEITPAYSRDEEDKWNPLRGTGLYEARPAVDIQESWTAFSHRVTSFVRTSNKVFIFPGKGELWTVYCQRVWSPFFVYVMESTFNIGTLSSVRPDAEGFSARCNLVIKTGEHETYRRTEKVLDLDDLSIFCFQVPYTFKQQADLLKAEIGTGGRRGKKIERHIRKMRKRKRALREAADEDEAGVFLGSRKTVVAKAPAVAHGSDSPPASGEVAHVEQQQPECVLEVDLRCCCRQGVVVDDDDDDDGGGEESESELEEIIVIDDDDEDEEDC